MNITVDKQYTEKAFISQVKADIKSFKSVFTEHDLLWTLSEKTGKLFTGCTFLCLKVQHFRADIILIMKHISALT